MAASLTVPGPRALPLLGAAGQLARFLLDPIAAVGRLFREHGPIAALVVGAKTRVVSTEPNVPGTVFVHGPELNRALLTNHADFHKCGLPGPLYPREPVSPRQRPITRMLTGLFHVNEAEHKQQRRLLMPAFHRSRIESYRDEMVASTEALLAKYRPGTMRDIRPDMMEVTLRIATTTLFGSDLGEFGLRIGRELEEWSEVFRGAAILPLDLPGLPYRRWLDLSHSIDTGIQQVIATKRANPGAGRDMLSMLLEARDEDGTALGEDELVGHAGVIFAAGHETSSNALSWTLFLLAQHPRVMADLCDELSAKLRGAAPTFDDLPELVLLDQVVKESLRLFPPAPMNHRITARDSELGDYRIPAGTEILASIYHTHRMPELYPEPLSFRPERWAGLDPGPYAFNPFSAGPRMCIGATFALFEIKIVLALLLQRFRFELVPGQRIDRLFTITMAPAPRVQMRIQPLGGRYASAARVRGNVTSMVQLGGN
ncbi:MAG TPA: cytochrome P450 [Polyangiaceae bacterium]|jgi:cytochrome P450|nr:cytochrome P450 [Polyangiaceae bacterium]